MSRSRVKKVAPRAIARAPSRAKKRRPHPRCRHFAAARETQVKGQLGAGDSSSIVFKGKPTPGKSELSQQQVVASYRRQAEQELNSERVPGSAQGDD